MIGQLQKNKIIWSLIALMALVASLVGVAHQGIYHKLTIAENLPAILSQDLISILASVAMLFLIGRIDESDFVGQSIVLGIVGYLFYVFGIYVLGKVYNSFYLLYMAIFSLSFFSLAYAIANIEREVSDSIRIPAVIRNVSAAFLLLIPAIFYPLWIVSMWPFMQDMRVPESGSNVYILDICFVLPVFVIVAVMLFRTVGFAILLTPALLIKGFTLCLSVALTEMLRPLYDQTWDKPDALLFGALTLACLVLTVVYVRQARLGDSVAPPRTIKAEPADNFRHPTLTA